MKSYFSILAQDMISKMGYEIRKVNGPNKFGYLLAKERHVPQKVKLSGRYFSIADPHSFYYSYKEIFIDKIYEFHSTNSSPFIIDCGSNYGTSILYFKQLYPNAKIVGFEADPSIYNHLNKNIQSYELKDVTVHNKAVWDDETTLTFYADGADSGTIAQKYNRNIKRDKILVETCRLSTYISDNYVDFLKIDIEGAENKVMNEIRFNLKNVNNIFIEYHSFDKGKQQLSEILNILEENNYSYLIHTQFASAKPFIVKSLQEGMNLQLNIFAKKITP